MKVILIGAGGHATVVCDTLLAAGEADILGFVGSPPGGETALLGFPVLAGSLRELPPRPDARVIVAIGNNDARRREWEQARSLHYAAVNAVHPSAILSPRCELGNGVMVIAGAIVNVGAQIGDNVILNTGCSVDHHCKIGAHTHVAPGARLAGTAVVGELTLIGAGAVILPGVTVGDRCTVGAGAVVTRDVPSGCTAVGVPARVVQRPAEA